MSTDWCSCFQLSQYINQYTSVLENHSIYRVLVKLALNYLSFLIEHQLSFVHSDGTKA